ncbi:hypothetical protein LCGC14_2088310, partial [marine sediment metagenome]
MIVSELLQKEAKERILIIDDDEDIRYSISLFLNKHNFKIEVAKDGKEGLEKISEKFYNLVLLDIKLPDIDGIELIIPIKEKQPDIEIIMITGAADINSAINSLNTGVSAYLNKPLNLDELLAHIRNSIEKQHLMIDKRKAERALRKSQQVLALKNRISAIFLTISDENVYGETLALVLKELNSKYGVFGYIDENGDYICPSMTRDVWEECNVPNKYIIYHRESWSSGNTIWGRSLISGESIYLNNPFKVPKGHIPMKNALTVPIKYNDEVIGLILVGNKKTVYDDNDVELLESITEYIAPILDARLQRDLEEKQRKQAEDKLKESEENWRSMTENSPAHVLLLDREHKIIFINRTVPDLSKEEVIGTSIYDYTPQEFHKVSRDIYNSVWETGEPSSFHPYYKTKEGDIR